MKLFKDFKEFAMRGNVVDLAVGVIIGGAFGKIVSSLVNDIIMPIIAVLTGGTNFTDLKIVLIPASDTVAETALLYGSFIQNVVDFLIIAFSIFIVIKLMTGLKKKQEASIEAAPIPDPTITLLSEIRDELKKR
ncbi:MAG: large-conductance mechanosensitive channel protein MscL [Erysipelotrichaceae bacterium]|nr:large-conductance mechanosensitive channel protein MscL [Erysipelotrichaceae bacterium]